jgi:hypothetical protein
MSDKVDPIEKIPDLRPGKYGDGHPLDDIQYVESKIILKPDRFTSRQSFWDFAKIVKGVAKQCDVGFTSDGFEKERPQIREVIFLDTADFRLYRNGFILRRRVAFEDGFPVSDPEIVFKVRGPDLQATADTDVRPQIEGAYRIKFKAEMLPLKDEVGGLRVLYSHNCEFPLSHLHEADRTKMSTIVHVLPALARIQKSKDEKVALVNHTIVRQGGHGQGQRGALACAGRPQAARGRVRLPGEVQEEGRAQLEGGEAVGAVLRVAATRREGLGAAGRHQDRDRLPAERKSAPVPRMSLPADP